MEIFSFSFLMQFVFGGSVFNSLLLRVLSFFLKEKKEKFSLGSLRMVFFFFLTSLRMAFSAWKTFALFSFVIFG